MTVLAIDPGKRKCGLAVVAAPGGIRARVIVPTEEVTKEVRRLYNEYRPDAVLVGGSTGSKDVVRRLNLEADYPLQVVDERHTTERARVRYFQDHPPKGLWRLVPLGLQSPPAQYDDYAAVVMAEQFLEASESTREVIP